MDVKSVIEKFLSSFPVFNWNVSLRSKVWYSHLYTIRKCPFFCTYIRQISMFRFIVLRWVRLTKNVSFLQHRFKTESLSGKALSSVFHRDGKEKRFWIIFSFITIRWFASKKVLNWPPLSCSESTLLSN